MPDEMPNQTTVPLVAPQTVRKIRYGVLVAHISALVIPMAIMTVIGWFNVPKEEVITVALYDPTLDNVVENPSPDPDPDNPIPPSGEPDATNQELPPPEVPEPSPDIPQPKVPDAQPKVNNTLPAVWQPPTPQKLKQPRVKPKNKPKPKPKPASTKPPTSSTLDPNAKPGKPGKTGQRGSNLEPGHNAPGGQRGNSGYDAVVASMIRRMWVTPDLSRLGGREPRVLIRLTIDAQGRVIRKEIVGKSGVLAMDESVAALLANLRTTVKPYDGAMHELSFYLQANED